MLTIILPKGIPASGKSTWALEFLKANKSYKRINRDLLRTMLHDYEFNKENERLVINIRNNLIYKLLLSNYNIIVDETNLNEKNYNDICNLAKEIGNVKVVEKYFPIDLKEAIERNKNRVGNDRVPKEAIARFDSLIKKEIQRYGKVLERTIEFPDNKITQDSNLPHAIICDIDGTLALNTSGRDIYNTNLVHLDSVNEPVKKIINLFNRAYHGIKGNNVILLSGRNESCYGQTEKWIKDNDICCDALIMRKKDDPYRKDSLVKRDLFEEKIKGKYFVEFVLDDRDQMIHLWRSMGIPCLQVNYGDF